METPFVDELVRRIRATDPELSVDVTERGSACLCWREPELDHPLVLLVTERDLAAAVTAIGRESRDALWPDSSVESAGFNLLLVHLAEVIATRDTWTPLRITDEGLVWPEEARSD